MTTGALSYRIEQPCAAAAHVVYGVLADVERWPDWMPGVSRSGWERRGTDSTDRGGIRRFTMRGLHTREQILDATPPSHQAYAMLSGMPVKNYRADVYIADRDSGSVVIWEATFDSRVPLLGGLIRAIARSGIAKASAALAAEAQRRAHLNGAS